MTRCVVALDQGTTSTRCVVVDAAGAVIASARREHTQHFPQPGWVECDAAEIWQCSRDVIDEAVAAAGLRPADVAAVGVTNQRETTVIWDRATGQPVAPAIGWQDTRTDRLCADLAADGGVDRFRDSTGLPLATYFSGPKIRWLLDTVPGLRARADAGRLLAGTIDSWIAWNLTGGADGGLHITDPTNASRTLLMDLRTLDWAAALCTALGVPRGLLPEIRPTSQEYAACRLESVSGAPLAALVGDQQAALLGQLCVAEGDAKCTYGTGGFLLANVGAQPVRSGHGLLETVTAGLGGRRPEYALEGSVAVAGSLVQWLRDGLGIIRESSEVETLARSVPDNGGAYLVPAFSGLFAPRWRPDARGVLVGLTRFVTRAHIARAALEAVAFQTRDVVDAMAEDVGHGLFELRVDGGMAANDTFLQILADILGIPVVRPRVIETTSLGAAYAAGLAVGFWTGVEALHDQWVADRRFEPALSERERSALCDRWADAVERSLDWVR